MVITAAELKIFYVAPTRGGFFIFSSLISAVFLNFIFKKNSMA